MRENWRLRPDRGAAYRPKPSPAAQRRCMLENGLPLSVATQALPSSSTTPVALPGQPWSGASGLTDAHSLPDRDVMGVENDPFKVLGHLGPIVEAIGAFVLTAPDFMREIEAAIVEGNSRRRRQRRELKGTGFPRPLRARTGEPNVSGRRGSAAIVKRVRNTRRAGRNAT